MKLYTPDGDVLLEIRSMRPHPDGLVIEGVIMGAMPMKAVLRADQVRPAVKLLSWPVVRRALAMCWMGARAPSLN
jgi:hypothetical protein